MDLCKVHIQSCSRGPSSHTCSQGRRQHPLVGGEFPDISAIHGDCSEPRELTPVMRQSSAGAVEEKGCHTGFQGSRQHRLRKVTGSLRARIWIRNEIEILVMARGNWHCFEKKVLAFSLVCTHKVFVFLSNCSRADCEAVVAATDTHTRL